MGRLMEIFRSSDEAKPRGQNNSRLLTNAAASCSIAQRFTQQDTFFRLSRFFRSLETLEARCPAHVDVPSWQQAVKDARVFLARWGEQAEVLGWSANDLFGLAAVPEKPHPNYDRLSRHDCKGLVWMLHGMPVVALTDSAAAIRCRDGHLLTFRRRLNRG